MRLSHATFMQRHQHCPPTRLKPQSDLWRHIHISMSCLLLYQCLLCTIIYHTFLDTRGPGKLSNFKIKLKKSVHIEKDHKGEQDIMSSHIYGTASTMSTLNTYTYLYVILVAVAMFAMYTHIYLHKFLNTHCIEKPRTAPRQSDYAFLLSWEYYVYIFALLGNSRI